MDLVFTGIESVLVVFWTKGVLIGTATGFKWEGVLKEFAVTMVTAGGTVNTWMGACWVVTLTRAFVLRGKTVEGVIVFNRVAVVMFVAMETLSLCCLGVRGLTLAQPVSSDNGLVEGDICIRAGAEGLLERGVAATIGDTPTCREGLVVLHVLAGRLVTLSLFDKPPSSTECDPCEGVRGGGVGVELATLPVLDRLPFLSSECDLCEGGGVGELCEGVSREWSVLKRLASSSTDGKG